MTSEQAKTQNSSKHQQTPKQGDARAGAGALKKIGSVISAISGYQKVSKNIGIIKHRASMPLLRTIFSKEIKTSKSEPLIVSTSELSDEAIQRSLFWHSFIIIFAVPALAWSILIFTKALAIGIRFETWSPFYNQGLYTSVPIILFTGSKLYVSWHSRKAFKAHNNQLGKDALNE